MRKRHHQIKVDSLSRFLLYILGRRPDEFGIAPDPDGFVTFKELLQAIHEEDGWRYVRQSHINEVLLGKDRPLFQVEEKRIRVVEKKWHLDLDTPATSLPPVLYTGIRKKAHPVVMEKGIHPGAGRHAVLSPDKRMAMRIGKRRDHQPVLIEIMSGAAQKCGIRFYAFGDLFLCPDIPPEMISGPPVPKENQERRDAEGKKDRAQPRQTEFSPGSFSLDMSRDPDRYRRLKGKKRKGWKEEARKVRKRKR